MALLMKLVGWICLVPAAVLVMIGFGSGFLAEGFPWFAGGFVLFVIAGVLLERADKIGARDTVSAVNGNGFSVASNRAAAMELTKVGGYPGAMAKNWLAAHKRDSSVPPFGMLPYWSLTGHGGTPVLISVVGLRGAQQRLEYVRHPDAERSLLMVMTDDPDPEVRSAARMRLSS